MELADEQIDVMSQAFLGMTISCARCHDHKFDPVTQSDYTALAGIFLSTETHYGTPGGVRARNASKLIEVHNNVGLDTLGRSMDPKIYALKQAELESTIKRRDAALSSRAPAQQQKNMQQPDSQISGFDIVRMITRAKQLETEIAAYFPDGSARPMVMGVADKPVKLTANDRTQNSVPRGGPNASTRTSSGFEIIADSPLFLRGSIENEADKVPRGVPAFLAQGKHLTIPTGSSGRLQLARWIASDDNTLTSRVIVNRTWYWLFGRVLVETVDNFGASGAEPSNLKLLDYLAYKFTREGWSLKKLIKEIVLSRVYQLESRYDEKNHLVDPDNNLYWRYNTRRLDAETIRDCILAASGQLDLAPGTGTLIAYAGDGPVGGDRLQVVREEQIATVSSLHRSVYLPIARSTQPELLAIFDFTDPSLMSGTRNSTIVTPQALFLMNSKFMEEQANVTAKRVMKETGFQQRFTLACRLTYCRDPLPTEIAAVKKMSGDNQATWKSICRALLSSADFLFVN